MLSILSMDVWEKIAEWVGTQTLAQTCQCLRRALRGRHWHLYRRIAYPLSLRWDGGGQVRTLWVTLHTFRVSSCNERCPWIPIVNILMADILRHVQNPLATIIVQSPCGASVQRGSWGPWWRIAGACSTCSITHVSHPYWPHVAAQALEEGDKTSDKLTLFLRTFRREKRGSLQVCALLTLSPKAKEMMLGADK